MKHLIAIIVASLLLGFQAEAARRTSRTVRQQQQTTARQIKETDAQIKENTRRLTAQLNQLSLIDGEIAKCNESIGTLNRRIDSIAAATKAVNDSVAVLDARLEKMQRSFAAALRNSRKARTTMSKLAFVFSSETFTQAFRRVRALRQFSNWRNRKSGEIASVKALLDERRQHLETLQAQSQDAMSRLAAKRSDLQTKQREAGTIMADLRGKERQLRQVLKQQRQKASSLDAELDRLIAAEQKAAEEQRLREEAEARRREEERIAREEAARREQEQLAQAERERQAANKPADKPKTKDKPASGSKAKPTPAPKPEQKPQQTTPKPEQNIASAAKPSVPAAQLGAKFGDNKGRLPYPVDGTHTIVKPFGRQRHPRFPNVEINNSGIDMQTASGATVKAVFDGRVSEIFCPDGYNNVVVVRHGDYVTVYANLGSISVRKGDAVSRGQALGTVYADPSDDNRSVLHFEIRNATNVQNVKKENPAEWLK